MKPAVFALTALLAMAGGAAARDAHVHGTASLQIAVEGNTLEIGFVSPLDDLLGFEHAPRDDRQRQAVQAMVGHFSNPGALFLPTGAAGCTAGQAELDSPLTNAARPGQRRNGGEHAELEATIVYRCATPSALKGLEVRLFDAFPRLQRIQAQVAGPRGQSAATLSRSRRSLAW